MEKISKEKKERLKKEGFVGKPTHKTDFPAKEESEMLLNVQSLFTQDSFYKLFFKPLLYLFH